ncbi:MAG: UbiA family prenyltransferase, partial [Calditrichaceae bacterium]
MNVLITIITIFIAALITGKFDFEKSLIYAVISAALIAAGANILNDIFDIDIDRINKPDRILPANKISIMHAWAYFVFAYATALVFAFLSGLTMAVIALIVAILLFLYSGYFKRTILLGNLIVSISAAAAFLYGAQAVSNWLDGLIPAVFALFFHFGREVVKDMQDVRGDLANNAVTFA